MFVIGKQGCCCGCVSEIEHKYYPKLLIQNFMAHISSLGSVFVVQNNQDTEFSLLSLILCTKF